MTQATQFTITPLPAPNYISVDPRTMPTWSENQEWTLDPHGRRLITNFSAEDLGVYQEAIQLFEAAHPEHAGRLLIYPEAYGRSWQPAHKLHALCSSDDVVFPLSPFWDITKLLELKRQNLARVSPQDARARLLAAVSGTPETPLFVAAIKVLHEAQIVPTVLFESPSEENRELRRFLTERVTLETPYEYLWFSCVNEHLPENERFVGGVLVRHRVGSCEDVHRALLVLGLMPLATEVDHIHCEQDPAPHLFAKYGNRILTRAESEAFDEEQRAWLASQEAEQAADDDTFALKA